jgi:hypothetical protein
MRCRVKLKREENAEVWHRDTRARAVRPAGMAEATARVSGDTALIAEQGDTALIAEQKDMTKGDREVHS